MPLPFFRGLLFHAPPAPNFLPRFISYLCSMDASSSSLSIPFTCQRPCSIHLQRQIPFVFPPRSWQSESFYQVLSDPKPEHDDDDDEDDDDGHITVIIAHSSSFSYFLPSFLPAFPSHLSRNQENYKPSLRSHSCDSYLLVLYTLPSRVQSYNAITLSLITLQKKRNKTYSLPPTPPSPFSSLFPASKTTATYLFLPRTLRKKKQKKNQSSLPLSLYLSHYLSLSVAKLPKKKKKKSDNRRAAASVSFLLLRLLGLRDAEESVLPQLLLRLSGDTNSSFIYIYLIN